MDYIIKKYDTIEFCRVNVDEISKYEIIIGGENQWTISCSAWKVKKQDIYSIYYRKPRVPSLDEFEVCYHGMIYKDIIALINGIVDDFDRKVLTKPYILKKTENKIFQLLYAEKNGWNIPESFIGNSNSKALYFANKKSIIKPITTGKIVTFDAVELYQTNYFEEFEDDISLTPIYLQEYRSKNFEVRLTYINGYFFAVRIDSDNKLDWRRNYNGLKYTIINCPKEVENRCRQLLEDFDLNYGAFDFIVSENNEWIFLEVNPNGQWQWLEQELNLPISQKIVEYLIAE